MSELTPEQRHRAGVLEAFAARGPRQQALIWRLEAGAPVDPALLCALAHLGGCRGPIQADHPITKQRLKNWHQMQGSLGTPVACLRCLGNGWDLAYREDGDPAGGEPIQIPCPDCDGGEIPLDELIADARNGWLLCELHHHNPHITVPRGWLPASVSEFAHDFRLGWSLERDFPDA